MMHDLIQVAIQVPGKHVSHELYHQARVAGAVQRVEYGAYPASDGRDSDAQTEWLYFYFEPEDRDKAMLFKLAQGGEQ